MGSGGYDAKLSKREAWRFKRWYLQQRSTEYGNFRFFKVNFPIVLLGYSLTVSTAN